MRGVAWVLAVAGASAVVAPGCANEPEPLLAGRSVAIATPEGLATRHDRCAYGVAKVAAAHLGCEAGELELQPVGPGAFLVRGCDRTGTYLCDEAASGVRVSER